MANITSFPLLLTIMGDGVSLTATVGLAAAPISAAITLAQSASGADQSSNIASVVISGTNVVITFNTPFTGPLSVELVLANTTYISLPLQPVAQVTSPWVVSGTVAVSNLPVTQPVSIAAMPTTPVTGVFWQTTQPISGAISFTAPQHIVVDSATLGTVAVSGTFWQTTQPVSLTSTTITGTVAVTAPTLTRGTQGSQGFTVQDLKDAGRTQVTFFLDDMTGSSTEVLGTMSITKGAVAQTAATSYTVTAGKTLRLTSIVWTVRSSTNAAQMSKLRIRTAASGIVATSPVILNFIGEAPAASVQTQLMDLSEGYEISGGTQIAMSHIENITPASTELTVCLVGFEY